MKFTKPSLRAVARRAGVLAATVVAMTATVGVTEASAAPWDCRAQVACFYVDINGGGDWYPTQVACGQHVLPPQWRNKISSVRTYGRTIRVEADFEPPNTIRARQTVNANSRVNLHRSVADRVDRYTVIC